MTETATGKQTSWAVRGDDGRVVVVISGAGAEEEARKWEARGYQVEAVSLD